MQSLDIVSDDVFAGLSAVRTLHDDILMSSKFALASMLSPHGQDSEGELLPGGGDCADGNEKSLEILQGGCECTESFQMALCVRLLGV
jgi:hypothetical protein